MNWLREAQRAQKNREDVPFISQPRNLQLSCGGLLLDTTAFILAGGRSSRMGTDKAFLRLGTLTLLEHAIATAKQVCETVALVGNRELLRPFGWVIEDKY